MIGHEPSKRSTCPFACITGVCSLLDLPKCLTVQGSHDALWCRTRAKQEADAAADLQRDLARIEELTVEIRSVSCCTFRFPIAACVPGFAWFRFSNAACATVFACLKSHMQHVRQSLHVLYHTCNMYTSLCMFQITHATCAPVLHGSNLVCDHSSVYPLQILLHASPV